jgi:hypothetical protein
MVAECLLPPVLLEKEEKNGEKNHKRVMFQSK